MTTKVNLPIVFGCDSEGDADFFCSNLKRIIPKVKFEHVGTDENNGKELFLFYKRRDQKYREMRAEYINEDEFVPVENEMVNEV